MSQENVEIVRRSFEAIGRWDIDGLLELYDPHVQFLPLTGTRVESGGYRGHAGVRAYFEEVANVWDELHPYGDDFRTVGNNVVVLGGCMVRGIGSGAEADTPMAWVVSVREGKITSPSWLPNQKRRPRSRRAVGVGDVAGERRACRPKRSTGRLQIRSGLRAARAPSPCRRAGGSGAPPGGPALWPKSSEAAGRVNPRPRSIEAYPNR
jgi:ketosteroid isomerase-like protein